MPPLDGAAAVAAGQRSSNRLCRLHVQPVQGGLVVVERPVGAGRAAESHHLRGGAVRELPPPFRVATTTRHTTPAGGQEQLHSPPWLSPLLPVRVQSEQDVLRALRAVHAPEIFCRRGLAAAARLQARHGCSRGPPCPQIHAAQQRLVRRLVVPVERPQAKRFVDQPRLQARLLPRLRCNFWGAQPQVLVGRAGAPRRAGDTPVTGPGGIAAVTRDACAAVLSRT